jgi:hypothetical protein
MPLLAVRGNGPALAYGFGASSGKESAITAIASTTLGTATSPVTFSSIPSTYDDLRVVCFMRPGSGGYLFKVKLNSSNTNNSSTNFVASSSGIISGYAQSGIHPDINYGSIVTQPVSMTIDILNYKTTSHRKTVLMRLAQSNNNVSTDLVAAAVGLWNSTSAVSSVSIELEGTGVTFSAGSVFALYGIKKAV